MASICNDERASFGVMSGHDRFTLSLSLLIAMSTDDDDHHNGHDLASIPLPRLSAEAVIQIQDFLYSLLDLLEDHDFVQIRRHHADQSAHTRSRPEPPSTSDPDPDLGDIPF